MNNKELSLLFIVLHSFPPAVDRTGRQVVAIGLLDLEGALLVVHRLTQLPSGLLSLAHPLPLLLSNSLAVNAALSVPALPAQCPIGPDPVNRALRKLATRDRLLRIGAALGSGALGLHLHLPSSDLCSHFLPGPASLSAGGPPAPRVPLAVHRTHVRVAGLSLLHKLLMARSWTELVTRIDRKLAFNTGHRPSSVSSSTSLRTRRPFTPICCHRGHRAEDIISPSIPCTGLLLSTSAHDLTAGICLVHVPHTLPMPVADAWLSFRIRLARFGAGRPTLPFRPERNGKIPGRRTMAVRAGEVSIVLLPAGLLDHQL